MQQTVYLVDDDPEFLASFGEYLIQEGYQVMLFQGGEQLLRYKPVVRPSLIVSDYLMPGMSGSELLRRLCGDARWQGVPAVVVTGSNDTSLPLRLDAPVVYKNSLDAMLLTITAALAATRNDPTRV